MAERKPVGRAEWGILIFTIATGAVLRVSHAMAGGLWRDEAQAVDISALPGLRPVVHFLIHHESHPPLFYLLLRGWMALTSGSDVMIEVPGILLGLGTITAAWWLVRDAASPAAGLLAAVFIAVNPAAIQSDATVRPYAMLQLLLVLAAGFLWGALKGGTSRPLAGWALCAILLLYTHHWTMLPLAGLGLAALWMVLRSWSPLPTRSLLWAAAAVVTAWAIWWPALLLQTRHGGHLSPSRGLLTRFVSQLVYAVPGLDADHSLVFWAAAATALILRWKALWSDRAVAMVLCLLAGAVFAAMGLAALAAPVANLLVVHTVAMLVPLALVALAIVLDPARGEGRLVAGIAAVLVMGVSGVDALRLAITPRSNVDLIADYVGQVARPEDLVLVVPIYVASSFDRYYHGAAPVAGYPDGRVASPLEFNDRVGRDTLLEVLVQVPALTRRILDEGGRIWEVSVEVPAHLERPWRALEQELEARSGPPLVVRMNGREATLENLGLRVWGFNGRASRPDR